MDDRREARAEGGRRFQREGAMFASIVYDTYSLLKMNIDLNESRFFIDYNIVLNELFEKWHLINRCNEFDHKTTKHKKTLFLTMQ